MKLFTGIFAGGLTLLNIKFNFFPPVTLFLVMFAAMILDFLTGVIKAKLRSEARTSEGYRKTVKKFTQYGFATIVSSGLVFLSKQSGSLVDYSNYISYMGDALVCFIIFIEITSILENIYAVDKESPFARYFIKPLLSLLTFQLKNNPVTKIGNQDQKES